MMEPKQNEALERKRLASQFHYLAALIDNVSDAIISTDLNFHIQSWNKAAETIYGWPAAEVIGQITEAIFKTEYAPGEREVAIQKLSETGRWEGEVIQRRKDGASLYIQAAVSIIKDEAGKPAGVVAVNRDITSPKRAEERFRTLFNTMTEGFSLDEIICDDTGKPCDLRYLEVNPAFEHHTGLRAADIIGRTTRELFPDAEPVWFERYGKVALTGEPGHFEAWFGPLGRCFDVRAYQTEPGRFAVVFFDITERKKAEEEIRSLARFPDENPNPVLRISKDGVILYANRSSQELLETWDTQIGSQIPHVWLETFSRLLKTGQVEEIELGIGGKIYSVVCNPFPESGYINLYGKDITEHKQADVELRVSEEKLKALFKLLPIGISILNEERQIMEVNPTLAKILDLSEDDLAKGEYGHRTYLRADGIPMLQGEFPSVQAFKEQRNIENVEIGIVKENGATLWTNVSAVPLPFPDWRVVVITSDVTGRKQAEAEREQLLQQARWDQAAIATLAQTLQRERDTLQTIMENTRAHLAYLDPQFNFVRVNSTYASGAGHTIEEVIGRNHFDLFPNPENQAIFERVRDTGQPVAFLAKPFEFVDQPERGITYWDWTLTPVKDGQGQVQGLVLSLLDVTERMQAEEKLHQALAQAQQHETEISALLLGSRTVLRSHGFEPAARLLFDLCKSLLKATAGFISITTDGGTEHKVIYLDTGGLNCTVDLSLPVPIRGLRAQAYRTGRVIYENHFSGSEWMEFLPPGHVALDNVLFAPLEIEQKVVGLLGLANKSGGFTENDAHIATAFSELAAIALFNSRTLESLENSETRFRSVAQTASEAIITIDSQGRIVYWNRAATTILGYPAAEAIGQLLTVIIPERFRAAHRQGLERLVSGGEARVIGKTVEMIGLRKDGAEFPLELSLSTWKVREEVFFTGIIHDITERKGAEMALRQAHYELEQRVQERTAELAQINQTLEQRVEERTHELATLLEASHNLASTLEMERLLGLILDQLKRVVDCSEVTIYKVEGESLIALAHRGPVPQEEISKLRFSLREAPVYRQVIFQQTSVIIPDVRGNTPLAQRFQESVGERLSTTFGYVRSWMGVPLTIKEQAIGMLGVHHNQRDYYTSRHAELAIAFANQAALAIENAQLYEQAQELAAIQERQRLARDLHDSVSQSLFSASLSAEVLPRLWERHPEEGRRCLAELHRLTRGALAEMRTLLLELRPTALVETALGELLSQLTQALAGRARLPVTLTIETHPPLPPDVQVALYRIAQEALNNVVKHAGASRVEVSLRPASGLASGGEPTRSIELRISDDGRGFEADHVSPVCLGLNIMRERAETIGAKLKIESRTGQGTQVVIVWSEQKDNL